MSLDSNFSINFELDSNKYELSVNRSVTSYTTIDLISPNLTQAQIDKVKDQFANLSTKEDIISKLKIMGATVSSEVVKTHQVGITNLSSLPKEEFSIEEFIVKVKNLSERMASPPKQEIHEEMMRQLKLMSELKKLRKNALQLDPKKIASNSQFKDALNIIDSHIASIQKYLDSTPVGKVREEEADNRRRLKSVRQKALADIRKGVSSEQVSKNLSKDIIQFIKSIFEEGIKIMGPPKCKYCLVAFGSLARHESGPFPDLDNMLILEKRNEETLKYFTKLYAYVEERLYRLGESENLGKPGLRFCTGAGSPQYPQYDFRYLNDATSSYLASIENHSSGVELRKAEEELKSIIEEIEQVQNEIVGKSSSELLKLQDKLKNLLNLKEMKIEEISKKRRGAFGGRLDLYIESSIAGIQGETEPQGRKLKKMQDDQRAMADNIFVCGDLDLYKQYKKIVPETVVGKVTHTEAGIMETIQFALKRLEEGYAPDSPSPIIHGKLSPITFIKEELYRFPQVIVSILAGFYKIDATNTIDRIKALQQKGALDIKFGEQLINCINQAIKLRILSQSHYHEEWDLVTSVDWKTYSAMKENMKREIEELPQIYEKILKYEAEVATLKDKVEQGNLTAKSHLIEAEKELKQFKEAANKREFLKFRLEQELPKIEQTEFGFQKAVQDLKQLEEEIPKLTELLKKYEIEIEQCQIAIQKLETENASTQTLDVEKLKLQQLNDNLQEIQKKLKDQKILADKLAKYEARGFKTTDSSAFEKFKEPILPEEDIKNLTESVLPTLHKLYELAQESVSKGTLNLNAFLFKG